MGLLDPGTLNLLVQLVAIEARLDREADALSTLADFLVARREADITCDVLLLTLEEQAFGLMKSSFEDNPQLGRDFILTFVEDVRVVITAEHANFPKVAREIAEWLAKHDFDEDAERLFEESLQLQRSAGAQETKIASTLIMLGGCKINLGKPAEAEALLRECLKLRREILEEGNWLIGSAESVLGEALADQGRYQEAEGLLLAGQEAMAGDSGASDNRKRESIERLVKLYEAWGRPDQAASWRARQDAEHDGATQG